MDNYPYYENQDYAEKTGQWTIIEWLNEARFRFYFPDRCGRLRLVAINNHADKDYRALDEDTLRTEFGVTYRDLEFDVRDGAQKAITLDDRCTWPAALYPDGPQTSITAAKIARPRGPALACARRCLDLRPKESCLGNRPAPQIQKYSDFGHWPSAQTGRYKRRPLSPLS